MTARWPRRAVILSRFGVEEVYSGYGSQPRFDSNGLTCVLNVAEHRIGTLSVLNELE